MALTQEQTRDIEVVRARSAETRRPTVAALEAILAQPIQVLDHGFIRVVDYMGDDAAVVQAARVSYGHGTKHVRQDTGLIRYLMRHRHTTPLEMCEIKFHVKLPIFVARQWIRHRTANVNEYSARYSILDQEFYLPAPEQIAVQDTNNRQGRAGAVPPEQAARILALLRQDAETAYAHYQRLLGLDDPDHTGAESGALARELARLNLPVSFYTQWYWKIDLHNLLHFLALRTDAHAQYEIRAYAEAILDVVRRWVPTVFEAFRDYRQGAVTLSAPAMAVVRRMLAGETVDAASSGLSVREWQELMTALAPPQV